MRTCTADRLCKLRKCALCYVSGAYQQFPNAYAVAKAEICPSGFNFLAVFGFSNCPPTIVEVKSIRFWAAISNDQVYSHLTMWNRMNVTRSHDSRSVASATHMLYGPELVASLTIAGYARTSGPVNPKAKEEGHELSFFAVIRGCTTLGENTC
jgi:hypothetical protein